MTSLGLEMVDVSSEQDELQARRLGAPLGVLNKSILDFSMAGLRKALKKAHDRNGHAPF